VSLGKLAGDRSDSMIAKENITSIAHRRTIRRFTRCSMRRTVGMFQVESRARWRRCRGTSRSASDIVVQVAIIRPDDRGGMIAVLRSASGKLPVEYPHPASTDPQAHVGTLFKATAARAMVAANFTSGGAGSCGGDGVQRSMERMRHRAAARRMTRASGTAPGPDREVDHVVRVVRISSRTPRASRDYARRISNPSPAAFYVSLLNAWPVVYHRRR
jgi:hypothetical protein